MKKQAKGIIGNILLSLVRQPTLRASLNQVGYVCMPAYMSMLKQADKHEDITQYPIFGALAESVINDKRTCLSYDRLYTIFQALRAIKDTPYANTIEVGVYKGGTSKFIVDVMMSLHPSIKLHHCAVDTFFGHDSKDILSSDSHRPGQFNDTDCESVKKYLSGCNVETFQGRFEDQCHYFNDVKFHFIHLDVDLYEPTLHALRFFSSRMAANGIIVVDDYANTSCDGVKEAVDKFMVESLDFMGLHLLTGQFIMFNRKLVLL